MRIGLIDVDGHNFPNLALMKLSSYHKNQGDYVEWYQPFSDRYDRVYMSKVFSFTPDYDLVVNADEVIKGGTGYAISLINGKEYFEKNKDKDLPYEVEHSFPDYSIYPSIQNTAYGYLTRGCPRGCNFCIVAGKEGKKAIQVASLEEFWNGQNNIILLDPNIIASPNKVELLERLADANAYVDFSQGIDARLLTEELCKKLSKIKMKKIHFAWDKYNDRDVILEKLEMFREYKKMNSRNAIVYVIVNFDTTIEQDLERIYTLRDIGYWAYVMIYDKQHCKPIYRDMQRWCNNRAIFSAVPRFEDYKKIKLL